MITDDNRAYGYLIDASRCKRRRLAPSLPSGSCQRIVKLICLTMGVKKLFDRHKWAANNLAANVVRSGNEAFLLIERDGLKALSDGG